MTWQQFSLLFSHRGTYLANKLLIAVQTGLLFSWLDIIIRSVVVDSLGTKHGVGHHTSVILGVLSCCITGRSRQNDRIALIFATKSFNTE